MAMPTLFCVFSPLFYEIKEDAYAIFYTRQANDAQHWANSYYNSARTANDPSHFISKAQSYEREAKEHMYRAQRYMNEANEWRQRGDMLQRQGK